MNARSSTLSVCLVWLLFS